MSLTYKLHVHELANCCVWNYTPVEIHGHPIITLAYRYLQISAF